MNRSLATVSGKQLIDIPDLAEFLRDNRNNALTTLLALNYVQLIFSNNAKDLGIVVLT